MTKGTLTLNKITTLARTSELRYNEREGVNSEIIVLQQKWINTDTGKEIWKDVPIS